MVQGTGSDVGKSLLVTGLCRAYAKRGLAVRPFKPQNMSNNAAIADDGAGGSGEIGRAQALQAQAARVPASVHMNPVLLKPTSEVGSQVVVQGRARRNAHARDYHALKPGLMASVLESFAIVRADADLVLIEGAGSPSEANLREGDIANMGFALAAQTPVIVVGDVARGAHGYCRFDRHHRIAVEHIRDLAGGLTDEREVRVSVTAPARRADGQHHHVRPRHRVRDIAAEGEAPSRDIGGEQRFQPGFVDWNPPCSELCDPLRLRIDASYGEPEL